MDFSKVKEKLKQFKDKTVKAYNKTVDSQASKLIASSMTIKTLFELDNYVSKSKAYYNTELQKDVNKQVIAIFADRDSDFYKKILYALPLLYTKSWTWNLPIKLVDTKMDGLELSRFQINLLPSLLLIENERIVKIISWEENVMKIIKWFSFNIEKSIKWKQVDQKVNTNNNQQKAQVPQQTTNTNQATNIQNNNSTQQKPDIQQIQNSPQNPASNTSNTQNLNNVNNISQTNTWNNLQNKDNITTNSQVNDISKQTDTQSTTS